MSRLSSGTMSIKSSISLKSNSSGPIFAVTPRHMTRTKAQRPTSVINIRLPPITPIKNTTAIAPRVVYPDFNSAACFKYCEAFRNWERRLIKEPEFLSCRDELYEILFSQLPLTFRDQINVVEFVDSGGFGEIMRVEQPLPSTINSNGLGAIVYKQIKNVDGQGVFPLLKEIYITTILQSSPFSPQLLGAVFEAYGDADNAMGACGLLMEELDQTLGDMYLPYRSRSSRLGLRAKIFSLSSRILHLTPSSRPRPPSTVKSIIGHMSQLAAAGAELHRCNLIHSDIKPANVMTRHQPLETGESLVLIDLGSCCPMSADGLAMLGSITSGYCKPRFLKQSKNLNPKMVDKSIDLYSFGITAYELLSGLNMYEVYTPTQVPSFEGPVSVVIERGRKVLCKALPPGAACHVIKVLDSCINRDASKRPPMAEVSALLQPDELARAASVESRNSPLRKLWSKGCHFLRGITRHYGYRGPISTY